MINFLAGFLLAIILLFTILFTANATLKGKKTVEYSDITNYMVKNNKSCITFDEIDRLSKTL